jgi:hypothetical protein
VEFIESLTFTRIITELVSDDDYANFQSELAKHPERGGPMAECAGIRKTRIALQGKGKSGGARIIYYYLKNHETIYLLYAFTKGEADNLSAEGKKSMREWSQQIRASYND